MAVGRRCARERCDSGVARERSGGRAACRAQGALPRHGRGSAALLRAIDAGALAAPAHRLGDDPPAALYALADRREIPLDRSVERLLGAALDDALKEIAEHL